MAKLVKSAEKQGVSTSANTSRRRKTDVQTSSPSSSDIIDPRTSDPTQNVEAAKQALREALPSPEKALFEFRRLCNLLATSNDESVPAVAAQLLDGQQVLRSTLDNFLGLALATWIPSESSRKRTRAEWKKLRDSAWQVDKLTLYAIFGETCARYRYLVELTRLSTVENDLSRAILKIKEQERVRKAGRTTTSDPKPADVSAVTNEIGKSRTSQDDWPSQSLRVSGHGKSSNAPAQRPLKDKENIPPPAFPAPQEQSPPKQHKSGKMPVHAKRLQNTGGFTDMTTIDEISSDEESSSDQPSDEQPDEDSENGAQDSSDEEPDADGDSQGDSEPDQDSNNDDDDDDDDDDGSNASATEHAPRRPRFLCQARTPETGRRVASLLNDEPSISEFFSDNNNNEDTLQQIGIFHQDSIQDDLNTFLGDLPDDTIHDTRDDVTSVAAAASTKCARGASLARKAEKPSIVASNVTIRQPLTAPTRSTKQFPPKHPARFIATSYPPPKSIATFACAARPIVTLKSAAKHSSLLPVKQSPLLDSTTMPPPRSRPTSRSSSHPPAKRACLGSSQALDPVTLLQEWLSAFPHPPGRGAQRVVFFPMPSFLDDDEPADDAGTMYAMAIIYEQRVDFHRPGEFSDEETEEAMTQSVDNADEILSMRKAFIILPEINVSPPCAWSCGVLAIACVLAYECCEKQVPETHAPYWFWLRALRHVGKDENLPYSCVPRPELEHIAPQDNMNDSDFRGVTAAAHDIALLKGNKDNLGVLKERVQALEGAQDIVKEAISRAAAVGANDPQGSGQVQDAAKDLKERIRNMEGELRRCGGKDASLEAYLRTLKAQHEPHRKRQGRIQTLDKIKALLEKDRAEHEDAIDKQEERVQELTHEAMDVWAKASRMINEAMMDCGAMNGSRDECQGADACGAGR